MSGIASPEPAECVREDYAPVISVVTPVSDDEAKVVLAFGERGRDEWAT